MSENRLCLGGIQGPLLIFGGPYSNLQATQAIKQEAERLSIPPENCICTGDIVAYCAHPKETVALIRDWGVHCIMGNCEESFANNAKDCGCGFDEGTQCDLLSAQWFNFSNSRLDDKDRNWFSQLPQYIHFNYYGKECLVVHGSVSSINQFIFNSTEEQIFNNEMALAKADLILGGHCGIPFTKKLESGIWHNAGAIGMPANDGTPRTWFSILNMCDGELTIEIRELNYDYQQAAMDMKSSELNDDYANTLTSGLWPSTDVLPATEKQQQGIPLKPAVI